ncbi:hypothetical protein F5876DRAFT_52972, partial [Lentinula aff. lateritia]
AGEFATSSRAVTGHTMCRLLSALQTWLANVGESYPTRKLNEEDWGGVYTRLQACTIAMISFRCLLHVVDVVDMTVANLSFTRLPDVNKVHLGVQPWVTKTEQVGQAKPSHFFLEEEADLVDLCLVRIVSAWLDLTGITSGYLFPKIFGYDNIQNNRNGHITTEKFLKNFRSMLKDIKEPPVIYTNHAFRRGGAQFLYNELGFNLVDVCEWGKWATSLSNATILRYLMADTDLVRTPRHLLMLPGRRQQKM